MILAAIATLWVLSGAASTIFWYTRDNDLVMSELGYLVFFSMLGPISFFVGASVHGEDIVLIKRRTKE